jgi:hypothetical protein
MSRFELEHIKLPRMFYDDCPGLVGAMEKEGGQHIKELYLELEESDGFAEYEFDAGMLDYEGGVNICRIFVPKPEKPADCVMIYLIFSKEQEPLRYLTVELSPEGGYELFGWDSSLAYKGYGAYDGRNERDVIDSVVQELLSGAAGEDVGGRYGEMCEALKKHQVEYYSEEVSDYIKMFDVIGELTENALDLDAMVAAFAALKDVVLSDDFVNSHDKIKGQYQLLDQLPETKGKLDRKAKLFFAFSVYAACSLISENDDKRHHYMGIAEFESAEYIKYKMEEYWTMEPYMFKVD